MGSLALEHCLVDWITIKQQNDGRYQNFSGRITKIDSNGEIQIETDTFDQVRGSYDTTATLKITDYDLKLSFNPSRWCREDNVFGVDYDQAIEIADQLLKSLDRPGLVKTSWAWSMGAMRPTPGRFVVTRIDFTLNMFAGSARKAEQYIRELSRVRIGRSDPVTFKNGVYHNTSARWKKLKCYIKHQEMRDYDRANKIDSEYRRQVADWCESNGLLRFEIRFGRDYLRKYGMRIGTQLNQEILIDMLRDELSEYPFSLARTALDDMPRKYKNTLCQWVCGVDVFKDLSTNTRAEHRREIKARTGIDIRFAPPDGLEEIKHQLSEVIELEEAAPPEWYRGARVITSDIKSA